MTKNQKAIFIIVLTLAVIGVVVWAKRTVAPASVAPIQIVHTETPVQNTNPNEVCYLRETKYEMGTDYAFISVNYNLNNNEVYGIMNWIPSEKDSLVGVHKGTVTQMNGSKMLNVIYTAYGEGIVNRQQEILLIGENDIKQGVGEKYQNKDGVYMFKDIAKLTYDNLLPKADCASVPNRIKANYSKQSDVLTTKYIGSQNAWPPKVTLTKGNFSCKEGPSGTLDMQTTTAKKTINGSQYCVTTGGDAAMGSTYTTYTYKTALGANVANTTFTLRFSSCGNYDEPQKAECMSERASFDVDAIVDEIIH